MIVFLTKLSIAILLIFIVVMDVLQLDIFIKDDSEDLIFYGAQQVLEKLRPAWDKKHIHFTMLTDGITNKLVKCSFLDQLNPNRQPPSSEDVVLIRIYGNKTDLFIDRKAETRNIQMLNKFALAPSLFAVFCNGLAYEYVPGCTLTTKTVRQPDICNLVARHMAKLHKVQPFKDSDAGKAKEAMLWRKLDSFLKLIPETFSNACVQKKFAQLDLSKQQISSECIELQVRLESSRSPIVFCHNDLLLGNVIHTMGSDPLSGEESHRVSFIDFEYADWNYQAYDIGNHFAEFAGVNNVDYDNYPCKDMQMQWLQVYASEFYADNNYSESHLKELYLEVNQFVLASHLMWGTWALVQAENALIDFDFIEYSSKRFKEYFRKKNQFLSITTDE